jgi:hypothetical protein
MVNTVPGVLKALSLGHNRNHSHTRIVTTKALRSLANRPSNVKRIHARKEDYVGRIASVDLNQRRMAHTVNEKSGD